MLNFVSAPLTAETGMFCVNMAVSVGAWVRLGVEGMGLREGVLRERNPAPFSVIAAVTATTVGAAQPKTP